MVFPIQKIMKSSTKIPSPLIIKQDQALSEPASTTAKFEEYVKNRAEALQISTAELRKVSEKEREEQIYQYLTPDEIWLLKDALKKVHPVDKINVTNAGAVKTEKATVEDFIFHEQKRHEYKTLTADEWKQKTPAEMEYYYQFLTPDEILEENAKHLQLNG